MMRGAAIIVLLFKATAAVVYILFSELNEAISELAPIEDQVNEAKSEKSSISSENARKLKKAEGKIRSIRDKQRDFEHTYNKFNSLLSASQR